MRHLRALAVTSAGLLLLGLGLMGPAASAAPAGVLTDAILGAATVTSTEVELSGVDSDALDTLAVPEVPVEPDGAVGPDAEGAALAVLTDQEATDSFDVLGVTWDDPAADVTRVLVRTRVEGAWTDWTELAVDVEGPDPGTAEAAGARPGTEPLVSAGSDGVQIRVEAKDGAEPDGLALTLVDGGSDSVTVARTSTSMPAPAPVTSIVSDSVQVAAPTIARSAASLRPAIVTRAAWGADESIRKPIDWNSTIKAVVVHHTVNANDYTRAQAPAIVRSIYAYHVKGRGWSDVGYHFLVDRFGTVYEGRKGSIDQIPLGVHTGGFNTSTIGIAAIGDYGKAAPSSAMLSSIAQVAAWKLAGFGRDPLGTTTLTAGSGSTRQTPGWTGAVKVISGHRDLATTACPGQNLYDALSTVRSRTAALMVPVAAAVTRDAAAPGSSVLATFYAGAGTVSWTASVTSACTGTEVRRLTGSGSRQVPVTWDLKDASGKQAPPGIYTLDLTRVTSSGALADRLPIEVLSANGTTVGCGYTRYGGVDRYATAVALGRAASPDSDAVVLVAGAQDSVVDGLVAAPFARSLGAPVLLTANAGLTAATRTEIARRAPSRVWLVGGTGVIASDVVAELKAMGVATVTRLSGADRFGTANAVATRMGTKSGVVLTSGAHANLIDSASVSGAAAAVGEPILLVRGDSLTVDTRATIASLHPTRVSVIGGTGAVSDAAVRDVRATVTSSVRRLGGSDRYATAIAVADGFVAQVSAGTVLVAAASDSHLIDSVTGGALGRLTLLIPGAASTDRVNRWLTAAGTSQIGVAGGVGAVAPTAVAALLEAVS